MSYGFRFVFMPALLSCLTIAAVNAENRTWWRATPSNCKNGVCFGIGLPCRVAGHSPAQEYEKMQFLGAQIVEKGDGLVAVIETEQARQMMIAGQWPDIIGYFFRSESDCINYINLQQKKQKDEELQRKKSLDTYR